MLKRGPRREVLAVNSLDETFYASPAIVGNEIYLRGDKHLFCFSKSGNKSHFVARKRRAPTRERVWGCLSGRRHREVRGTFRARVERRSFSQNANGWRAAVVESLETHARQFGGG